MNRMMITASNTLGQLQKKLDIISNNVANVDTYGYKKREASFTDLMYQQINNQRNAAAEIGRLTPMGIRQGTGAKVSQSQIVMAQGAIKNTDRALDTAFTKEGQLFKVLVQREGDTEIQYTRNGAFYLTPVGENELALVNGDGHFILDENDNPIYINGEPTEINIDGEGRMTVALRGGAGVNFNLGVVKVNNPQFLELKGDNLFGLPQNFAELNVDIANVLTELTGPLRAEIGIQQGALEQSNVDLAAEMTNLIQVQRAYQFQSRSITIADQMSGLINGIR